MKPGSAGFQFCSLGSDCIVTGDRAPRRAHVGLSQLLRTLCANEAPGGGCALSAQPRPVWTDAGGVRLRGKASRGSPG